MRSRWWDLHSPQFRAHDVLDDDGILVALVLNEERMLRVVDELRDLFPPRPGTPDET